MGVMVQYSALLLHLLIKFQFVIRQNDFQIRKVAYLKLKIKSIQFLRC